MTNIILSLMLYSSYINMVNADYYVQSIPSLQRGYAKENNPVTRYFMNNNLTNAVGAFYIALPLVVYSLFDTDTANIIMLSVNVLEFINIYINDHNLKKNNYRRDEFYIQIPLYQYTF